MFYNIFKSDLTKHGPSIIGVPAIQAGFTNVTRITQLVNTMTAGPLSHYAHLFPELKPDHIDSIIEAGSILFSKTFPLIYWVSIPFGAIACVASLALRGIDKHMDNRVAIHL